MPRYLYSLHRSFQVIQYVAVSTITYCCKPPGVYATVIFLGFGLPAFAEAWDHRRKSDKQLEEERQKLVRLRESERRQRKAIAEKAEQEWQEKVRKDDDSWSNSGR